jgi:Nif-specific regulatory protein
VRRRLAGTPQIGDPDVRVLVSSGAALHAAVECGRFMADLYRVLAVMPLRVPSLAERRDDVALWAAEFLRQASADVGGQALSLSPCAVSALEAAAWPGNLRELADVVGRGARRAAADGVHRVEGAHLFPAAARPSSPQRTLQDATRRFQAGLVRRVLDGTRWDVAAAARLLGLAQPHLDTLIRTFQLGPST